MGEKLTLKQKLFVEHYLATRNGVQSAREAGYDGDDPTLRAIASENLTKPNIRAEIDKRLEPFILSANEVLSGLSRIADIDIAQVFESDGSFDLASAKERGVSKFIKSISFDKDTGKVTKVELYSAHEGFRDMGKFHKLFTEKSEQTVTTVDHLDIHQRYLQKCLDRGISSEEAEILADRAFRVFEVKDETNRVAS